MANDTMTAKEVAHFLGVSTVALHHLRRRSRGPSWTDTRTPGTKNARPMYDRTSVEAWAEERANRTRQPMTDRQRIAALEQAVASLKSKLEGRADG